MDSGRLILAEKEIALIQSMGLYTLKHRLTEPGLMELYNRLGMSEHDLNIKIVTLQIL